MYKLQTLFNLCLNYCITKQGTHQTTHTWGDKLGRAGWPQLTVTSPSPIPAWYRSPEWPYDCSSQLRVHELRREHKPKCPGPGKKYRRCRASGTRAETSVMTRTERQRTWHRAQLHSLWGRRRQSATRQIFRDSLEPAIGPCQIRQAGPMPAIGGFPRSPAHSAAQPDIHSRSFRLSSRAEFDT